MDILIIFFIGMIAGACTGFLFAAMFLARRLREVSDDEMKDEIVRNEIRLALRRNMETSALERMWDESNQE